MDNIQIQESNLQCDNYDWSDAEINFETYKDWIDKPCPKCGHNVLTQEDYQHAEIVRHTIEFINAMTPEQIAEFNKNVNMEELKSNPMISGLSDIDLSDPEKLLNITVSTHKNIN